LQVITPKSTGREVVQIERKVSNITPKQVVFQQVNQASIHEPSKQESITEDISLTVQKRFQLMDKHSNLTLLGNAGKVGSCD
jgi:predicted transcriptional regulator